jgi:hypothetical protein
MKHLHHPDVINVFPSIKTTAKAECQWLTPVMLAILEAEIRRIMVQSQPWQRVHKSLSRKYLTQ